MSDVYYGPFASALVTTWGWPVETGTHLLRLICAGVFDRHLDLKIIIGHMGELLPYCYTRINQGLTMAGWLLSAQSKNRQIAPATALRNTVDYPFQDNFAAMEFLERCDLAPEDKERFAHRTAENLLKLDNWPNTNGVGRGGDAWYRLRSRAKSRIGRALISALVK